ncbi:MAG: hypothetical protein BWX54_01687 [Verrucomicrobia bacterium ADurb.Bin018]|nr:MAG: hypothetical protein BWX54_01687 [Verrucomicrobia bacterium ADurb.Bin018]
MLFNQNILLDPFPKRKLFQKFGNGRTGPTPSRQLFVRKGNLDLPNLIPTFKVHFVLHFFVLLAYWRNKSTVKHLLCHNPIQTHFPG